MPRWAAGLNLAVVTGGLLSTALSWEGIVVDWGLAHAWVLVAAGCIAMYVLPRRRRRRP